MKFLALLPFLFLLVILFGACAPSTTYTGTIPNLRQVSPGLWRSGQPVSAEDWAYLKGLGVRTVVKLNFVSEGSDDGATAVGISVHVLSIEPRGDQDVFDNITNTFLAPDPQALAEAARLIDAGGGVLIHCTHGQDRTGLVVGQYRVRHGMTKDEAYKEMLAMGFHPALHGLHEFWEGWSL